MIRGKEPSYPVSEPALRVIMRRLRDIMAEEGDGQSRLDAIVHMIAGVMVAEVCSIYLRRQDGSLELFATEGLKRDAVHATRLNRSEGLVGRCAEIKKTINVSDAPNHPAFSYRPETGEETYHSLLAVPIQRSGQVLGVLVVQNHKTKNYSDEDVEVLQSTAMVVAELLTSGAVAGAETDLEILKSQSHVIKGDAISEGIALGHAVFHESRVAITTLLAEDPVVELSRIDDALAELKNWLDRTLKHEQLAEDGEHRDVLEAYRMFAHDPGWEQRLRDAVQGGLTAEAAVGRVQNLTRARMLHQPNAFWIERAHDLDDLSDRLLRILSGRPNSKHNHSDLPDDTILIARTMGPAELLDYDHTKLRGLIVEGGSDQSHVAIVAKALGLAAVGQAKRIIEHVSAGDAVIVDAESGEVHLRPSPDVVTSYVDKVQFRARRQKRYAALRDKPAVTKDGVEISLQVNAGLQMDVPQMFEAGADGIGLFRTELLFMLSQTFPRLDRQTNAYRAILEDAGDKPVVFRTLDIGGDKVLPYLDAVPEENPAMGWRAVRMSLDRTVLLRTQLRALLRAAAGKELHIMVPMITASWEMGEVRKILAREVEFLQRRDKDLPTKVNLGAMFEVPSLLFELDDFLPQTDFISIGSNDLMQFFYAVDRTNGRVANRYDSLSPALLRALKVLVTSAAKHNVPVTVCGEMSGRPLEALALIGLGIRSLSMPAAAVGPVKEMVRSLDCSNLSGKLNAILDKCSPRPIREELTTLAKKTGIKI